MKIDLLKHYKRQKAATNVSIEQMFGRPGTPYVRPRKNLAFVLKHVLAVVALASALGALLAVYPLIAFSAGIKASEPVVQYWKELPSEFEKDVAIGERNVLYDINGKPFASLWVEDRIKLTNIDQVSDFAIKALVATEDKNFYKHAGFDPKGTIRAAITGRGGGSGITQQLIKNLQFFNLSGKDDKKAATEATIGRKIRELKLSLGYEKSHTKDEILLNYFNTVAFGGPNTYSIEKAASYYFGKHAKDLTLAQSAVLVGSVQSPSEYNLASKDQETIDAYKARQKSVLSRMVAEGYITQQQADEAYAEPLEVVLKGAEGAGTCAASAYPFYCDYVMDYLRSSPKLADTQQERDAIIARGGLHIKTYLDPEATDIAQRELNDSYGIYNPVAVPTVIVQPGTGGVLVAAVNRDYGTDEEAGQTTLNLANHKSGTGSAYKMITLAAATTEGYLESDLAFSSMCPWQKPGYETPPGGIQNSDSCALQGGYMDYRRATAFSSNTWYVELQSRIGVDKIKEFSTKLNLSAPDDITNASTSYTLGSVENSSIDMAAAFATFANHGIFCPATPVSDYAYADGTRPALPEGYDPASTSCRRVMSPSGASTVLKAMRANISGEIPGSFGSKANIAGFDTAAKSGTNQLYNSTWAHLSANYSLFANAYNPVQLTDGIDYLYYKGRHTRWWEHVTQFSSGDILRRILTQRSDYAKLDYGSTDTSITPVPVDTRDMFTVPSVIGMRPQQALSVLNEIGIEAHLAKETKPLPAGFSSGVIVAQSIEPGSQLVVGTKKSIIIYADSLSGIQQGEEK